MNRRSVVTGVCSLGDRVLSSDLGTLALWVGIVGVAAMAVDGLLLVAIRPSQGPVPGVNARAEKFVFACAVVALATVLILTALRARRGGRRNLRPRNARWTERFVPRDTAVAALLSLGALLVLSVIPTYLLARASEPPHQVSVLYAYLDRRWLVAGFLLASLGPMVLLVVLAGAAGRARAPSQTSTAARSPRGDPDTGVASAGIDPGMALRESPGWVTSTWFRIALAALLGWYFFGPPWGIGHNQQPIDFHEVFQLGALQALGAGATPYLGAAGSQYGPGSQLVAWLYMNHVGTFSIVGFREVFALFQWTAATVVFATLLLRVRLVLALATIMLAILVFPTLRELAFGGGLNRLTRHNTFGGFFGWFNLWRYSGVFVLLMLFPAVVGAVRLRAVRGLALGALWGLSCYMAQENLSAGILGVVVLALLLVASESARRRETGLALGAVALGAMGVWIPVLIAYGVQGDLHQFITNCLLVPDAVTQGYSNTPFEYGWNSQWGPLFYSLPIFLCLLAVGSIVELRPLRIAGRWSQSRTLMVAVVVISVVTYAGALLRSDASHLINTTLALPLLVVLTAVAMPRLLPLRSRTAVVGFGLAVAAATAAVLPPSSFSGIPHRLWAPAAARYSLLTGPDLPAPDPTVSGTRIGRGLSRGPICCTSIRLATVPMPRLVAFLNELHAIIGHRRTYVTRDLRTASGLIYFGADLAPARMYVEPGTMLVNQTVTQKFLAYFQAHIREVGALVTDELPSPELQMFLAAFPRVRDIHLTVDGQDVHVLLRR